MDWDEYEIKNLVEELNMLTRNFVTGIIVIIATTVYVSVSSLSGSQGGV
jgi:choline-glycine betaine transporter